MPLSEALRLAVQAIWTSKLRSFFTLLGIIVSVGFLVVVVAVIQGMNAYVTENLTGAVIGTNAFQVRRSPISVGRATSISILRMKWYAARWCCARVNCSGRRHHVPHAEKAHRAFARPHPTRRRRRSDCSPTCLACG